MVQLLPYIFPLMLGRTFNLDKMTVGVDIFPKDVIEKKLVIENPVSETHYKIVDNVEDARDLLDVGGSFSLNVKMGVFKAGASGEYLSDVYNKENTVEVAVKATYQSVTEQLPADAKPIETWKLLGDAALGTHFVRSITYGADLIAAIRLEGKSEKDKKKIKGALEVGGKIEIFDLGVEGEGAHMKDFAKSVENTQIKVFSSIPISKLPNDMEELKKTMDAFPDDLKQFNGGKGVPVKMELWPLSMLDSKRQNQLRNRILETSLDLLERKFDDLLNTKTAISDWMKTTMKPLTDDQESKIGELYGTIEKILQEFYEVIGSLDMSKGVEQLNKADNAYGTGIPGTFYRKYLQLRQEITKDQGAWTNSRSNGVTYTHWGKRNCSGTAEQLSTGDAVGPRASGGGANLLCMPLLPHPGDKKFINSKEEAVIERTSFKFFGPDQYQIFCSTCRLGSKSSVQVFSGRQTCPDDWDYVYDGLLMSGFHDIIYTNFVCLDRNAEEYMNTDSKNLLLPNWSSLVENGKKSTTLFPCVVCAK